MTKSYTAQELMAKYILPITVKLNIEDISENWKYYKEYIKTYKDHKFQLNGFKLYNNELRVIEENFPVESTTPMDCRIYQDIPELNTPRTTSMFIDHRDKLKDSIYGQDELLSKLNFFHKRISSYHSGVKPNLCITGPTGTGKTFTLDNYFKKTKAKLIKFNASILTSSGYKGNNLSDIARAIFNAQKERHSSIVVYLDEIDKLLLKSSDVSKDVFSELLAFIEGDTTKINNKEDEIINVDLSRVFFIFSGAFQGKEIHSKQDVISNFPDVVGINEFCGRINSFASTQHFDQEDLVNILKLPKGEMQRMIDRLENEGIKFSCKEALYSELASKISYSNSGARVITELTNTLEYLIFSQYPKMEFDSSILNSPAITKIFSLPIIKKEESSDNNSLFNKEYNYS